MFRKKMIRIALMMILMLIPVTAQSGQEPPPWAEPVMAELGCMGGMFGEMDGKIYVEGIIIDQGAKLKTRGFKIETGAPYRVSATKISDTKYEVRVSRMDQRNVSETKIVEIK